MESKKTNYASVYDSDTNTVHINGMWSDAKFRKLTEEVGIDKIGHIIIHDGGTLHLSFIDLSNITVERYGFLSARFSMLANVNSCGIVRVRNSTLKSVGNDGEMFVSQASKLMGVRNQRHIEISKSYAKNLACDGGSSIKATSSFLVDSEALDETSICIGSSRLIACGGALNAWSDPYFDSPAARPYIIDYRLLFAAVELISMIDYIDSNSTLDARQAKLLKYIDATLSKKHTLPFDIAKDLIATVHPLSTKAQNNLRRTIGYRAVVFGSGGVGPRPLLKKKK